MVSIPDVIMELADVVVLIRDKAMRGSVKENLVESLMRKVGGLNLFDAATARQLVEAVEAHSMPEPYGKKLRNAIDDKLSKSFIL